MTAQRPSQRNVFRHFRDGARRIVVSLGLLLAMLPGPSWAGASPFEITVDGQPMAGSAPADSGQATDMDLEKADIQVKFDGLGVRPMLNVSTMPVGTTYKPGDEIKFLASWNYGAFIKRAEIRIYEHGGLRADHPLYVVPVTPLGAATWSMPATGPDRLDYVVRVYDDAKRFDQTLPLPLARSGKDLDQHDTLGEAVAPGYGEDRTDVRNIPVYGGAVTVSGHNVPAGHSVTVMGEPVPIDNDNAFVTQRILPIGKHMIDVSVLKQDKGLTFSREIEIPATEWFYIGQADVTARYRTGSKHIEDVNPGEYDRVSTDGRFAFYLKGKIKGIYLLTASADTGDDKLLHVFRGLDGKGPRELLRRIDPNSYYPVYGDDSTAYDDAPTRGKFYVRLDRGPSHVMWGTFKSNITGTQFLANDRELYGASGVYRSDSTTSFGEAQRKADVYVAQPGTMPQRDMFRGTGGSAYFLSHMDITPGSETVTVEVRNSVTGVVAQTVTLLSGQDYSINYVQGIVMLTHALPSTDSSGGYNYLVVGYEYTPVSGDVNGYVYGGRGQQWLGDHVRVGATAEVEKTGGADQKMLEADARLQVVPETYIEGEVARSEGPGFSKTYSLDGGLSSVTLDSSGTANRTAYGYRANAHSNLTTVTDGWLKGSFDAYYLHEQAGFSTLSEDTDTWKTNWGAKTDLKLSDRTKGIFTYDEQHAGDGNFERQLTGKTDLAIDEHWTIEPGVKLDDRTTGATDTAGLPIANSREGYRDDARLAAIYAWDKDDTAYVFGQKTFHVTGTRESDDRAGVGFTRRLTEKLTGAGEVSYGDLGLDAKATLEYAPTANDRYYIGYTLDQERAYTGDYPYTLDGNDLGTIVGGVRHRFSDKVSVFGEDNYDIFGKRLSLGQTYGVTYTPDPRWNRGASGEVGRVYDNSVDPVSGLRTGDLRREALSVSALYKDQDGIDGKLKAEIRHDYQEDGETSALGGVTGTGPSNTMAYLVSGGLGVKTSENWRALASIDTTITTSTDTTKKGTYVESSLGYAYRPAEGDRWNALFKYTFLYDYPGADQVSYDGTKDGPLQLSHIFSADVMYDVNHYLTLGGKVGVRFGAAKLRDGSSGWMDSAAELGILRADVHVVHDWDALAEARVLHLYQDNATHFGLVAALYRHLGPNVKLGAGYNFGAFSDDLRDQTLNDHGVFVNLLGEW